MRKVTVLVDFIKLPVTAKITFYRNVITRMSGNPLFSSPDVSLEEAITATNTLESTFIAAQDGGHTAIAAMHDAEKKADTLFHTQAAYVERIANGDETAILSSGFHPSAQPAVYDKPALAVSDGKNSGSVKLIAKAVEKAGSYTWQMAKDALPEVESGWTTIGQSTGANYETVHLTVGGRYFFRVAAVTTVGMTDYTAPVMKIVV